MRYSLSIFVFLVLAMFASAQKPPVKLNLIQLQDKIHLLDGGLGNMTVLADTHELLLVDTKAEEVGALLEEFIKTEFKGKKVRYITNTHTHFDHMGNNKRLGKGATIIAHQNSHKALKADSQQVHEGWPNLTFDTEMSLFFGGEEIRLIHFPLSHTNHDVVVYFTKSKVLCMGDMYFSGMYPYIASDGTLNGLITSLGKLINMLPPDIKIVPGHGPVSTLEDLKATHAMLVGTSEYIKKQIASGKSLEQIKKEGLPAWTPVWGKGFCKETCWIETVYDFLKK